MPIISGHYAAPTWMDGGPPAINAAELQAICDTLEENDAKKESFIETGTYIGTGTYGADNPCELHFSFVPSLVWMWCMDAENYTDNFMCPSLLTTSYSESDHVFGATSASCKRRGKRSEDGKTIYWYHTDSASNQRNSSNKSYGWIAFGKETD